MTYRHTNTMTTIFSGLHPSRHNNTFMCTILILKNSAWNLSLLLHLPTSKWINHPPVLHVRSATYSWFYKVEFDNDRNRRKISLKFLYHCCSSSSRNSTYTPVLKSHLQQVSIHSFTSRSGPATALSATLLSIFKNFFTASLRVLRHTHTLFVELLLGAQSQKQL